MVVCILLALCIISKSNHGLSVFICTVRLLLLFVCRMWWTITGNYGNILPIDWSKSYTQQLQEKSLKLGEKRVSIMCNL